MPRQPTLPSYTSDPAGCQYRKYDAFCFFFFLNAPLFHLLTKLFNKIYRHCSHALSQQFNLNRCLTEPGSGCFVNCAVASHACAVHATGSLAFPLTSVYNPLDTRLYLPIGHTILLAFSALITVAGISWQTIKIMKNNEGLALSYTNMNEYFNLLATD